MKDTRTRRLTAGAVVMTLLGGVFALLVTQPASAITCGTYSLTLSVSGAGIARSGAGTDTAHPTRGTNNVTATITNAGNPDPNESVLFLVSDNSSSAAPGVVATSGDPSQPAFAPSNGPGKYITKITAGANPGPNTVTATFTPAGGAPCTAQTTIVQFGFATSVSVTLSPNPTPVSPTSRGQNTVTATATVRDDGGRLVKGESVVTSISSIDPPTQPTGGIGDPGPPPSSATQPDIVQSSLGNDNGNGTYTDAIDVSVSPSRQTVRMGITTGTSTGVTSTSVLTQYGPAKKVALGLSPSSIPANGVTASTATAIVSDIVDNRRPGTSVSFIETSGPAVTFSPASGTSDSNGVVQVSVVAGTSTGTAAITAISCSSNCQNAQNLTLTTPAANNVAVSMSPSTITADGVSTSTATAIVSDDGGGRVANTTVTFTRTGVAGNITGVNNGNGVYTAVLKATTDGADEIVTATTANGKSGSAFLYYRAAPTPTTTTTTTPPPESTAASQGYTLVGADGGIFTYGTAQSYGSTAGIQLKDPIIGIANKAGGTGYWLVARDGGVFAFGDAEFYGSLGGVKLNAPVLGIEATPTGKGYWLFAADGGIFTYGDALFYGSTGGIALTAPAVGLAVNEKGDGYWLVAKDGGIFSFGNVPFHGSTGDRKLNKPVFDMAPTAGDRGYYLVAEDGGIFSFGDAADKFFGSAVGATVNPVIGIGTTPTFNGYWIADSRGGVFPYGDATFLGDRRNATTAPTTVGFATVPRK